MTTTVTNLWRPVGAYELRLIVRAGFTAYPPRLPGQPIFYPVCNEEYAVEIARRWNLTDPNSGYSGFVTRFRVPEEVASAFPRRVVGARRHEELWVPAEQLESFCGTFSEKIAVVRGWLGERFPSVADWSGPLGELDSADLARVVDLLAEAELRGGPRT